MPLPFGTSPTLSTLTPTAPTSMAPHRRIAIPVSRLQQSSPSPYAAPVNAPVSSTMSPSLHTAPVDTPVGGALSPSLVDTPASPSSYITPVNTPMDRAMSPSSYTTPVDTPVGGAVSPPQVVSNREPDETRRWPSYHYHGDHDLLISMCPDSLNAKSGIDGIGTCRDKSSSVGRNCNLFHICPEYLRYCVGKGTPCKLSHEHEHPDFTQKVLHVRPTCLSVKKEEVCRKGQGCMWGHDQPEARRLTAKGQQLKGLVGSGNSDRRHTEKVERRKDNERREREKEERAEERRKRRREEVEEREEERRTRRRREEEDRGERRSTANDYRSDNRGRDHGRRRQDERARDRELYNDRARNDYRNRSDDRARNDYSSGRDRNVIEYRRRGDDDRRRGGDDDRRRGGDARHR
ncbi:hypothetical protein OPT61_g3819 [Boeremia exigua]|uniref:Uncharacterized protein n=1 Tax=Boeremia exigua TaxID=749465 RepID=A0ACC2IGD8_9PLEO|nr:hypothetical protein OPT61_g3819 [Boeremia exigua]